MHSLTLKFRQPVRRARLSDAVRSSVPHRGQVDTGSQGALPDSERSQGSDDAELLSNLLQKIESCFGQLQGAEQELFSDFATVSVSLAVRVASAIVGREFEVSSERLSKLVEAALKQIDTTAGIVVRLNPVDYQRLFPVLQQHHPSQELTLESGDDVSLGDCRIHSLASRETIIASCDQLMKQVERHLLEAIHHG